MAAWVCRGCTAVYAVGAPARPQCGSTDHCEQGDEMPKIHADRPPTNADAEEPTPPIGAGAEADSVEATTDQSQPETNDDDNPHAVERPDYEALTVPTLRGYLADRLLPTEGLKPELVARLQEDDERKANE